MGYSEIGSEFWSNSDFFEINEQYHGPGERRYLMSGRTALAHVIRDMKQSYSVRRALLPSYCCQTMIEPFVRNGVQTAFYSVTPEGIRVPDRDDYDAVLVIDYFGYVSEDMLRVARSARLEGKLVIYDGSHHLGAGSALEEYAQYSICSLRKWCYCNTAVAVKHTQSFQIALPTTRNMDYELLRERASEEKSRYMSCGAGDKGYLALYGQAQSMLQKDYEDYVGQPIALKEEEILQRRRENASYLIWELTEINGLRLLCPQLGERDTPLFVPILIGDGRRDELRQYLIQRQIYCPVHWPIGELHTLEQEERQIYSGELSLICDQRYGLEEMWREAEAVRSFLR